MKERIAGLSVLVNFILAVGKVLVGLVAGSSAVLAEGIHSGMDVISSVISLAGIKIAKKPVDSKHPYGHYKFEVLSGLVITVFLFVTGVWVVYDAVIGFAHPSIHKISYLALGVMFLSAVLNEVMARLKVYYGKKENSLSLLSDGIHDRVDVYTSLAVLVGLFVMPYWIYVDSLLALLIGLYIIKESFSLGKEATDSLLDVSAGEEIEEEIRKIAKKEGIEIADLKTQKKGSVVTANLVVKLPKNLSVEEATEVSRSLKRKLIKAIEPLEYVAIQIESHDFTDSFFKPRDFVSKITSRKGFGWQRKGRFVGEVREARGKGPEGYCVCPKCGYKIKHERGVPCATLECPKCEVPLTRD